jgi:uncharacterized membrane protein YfcA
MAVAGLMVGGVVGLTGMGGGALLTPILVLVFKVPTLAAVSSDLVVSLVIKPVGALVHHRQRTIRTDVFRWLAFGSIPSAFIGSALIHALGGSRIDERLKLLIGITLLMAAVGMIVRSRLRRHDGSAEPSPVRPLLTLSIGVFGGLLVGLTSVGSGSLMIVLLMWAYPRLGTAELVGTDLAQAVPLVASAALGHVLFGDVKMAVVGSLLVGALPGVWLGSQVSSRGNSRVVRPILVAVLAGTGLKLVGII